jgi:hypothetical protein
MLAVLRSRAVSLCLVAGLAAFPLAPVEHVHRTDGPDGHHRLVAHAHVEDHHHAEPDDHDLATHVEDDDTVVLTIDRVFVPEQPAPQLARDAAADHYLPPLAVVRAGAADRYLQRLIHGPPRGPTSLRAPPSTPSV